MLAAMQLLAHIHDMKNKGIQEILRKWRHCAVRTIIDRRGPVISANIRQAINTLPA